MIASRTDDLRYADWLHEIVPAGFANYRKIVNDGDELSPAALTELIAVLTQVTPAYLRQEVSFGLWEGHPGLFGGGITADFHPGGKTVLTRAVTSAVYLGTRMTAFRDRRRADTAAWLDGQIHKRLELSGHRYLLFRGPLEPITQWFRDSGPVAFRHGPDLIWPDDHSWMVAAPVRQGFTVVAGDRGLADLLDSNQMLQLA